MDGHNVLRSPERLSGGILRIKGLSVSAKRIYSLISYCQGADPGVSLATSWIASRLAISRQAVSRAIGQLTARKLIRTQHRPRQSSIFSVRALSPKNFFLVFYYALNSGQSESAMLILNYLKFRQGDNGAAWPHVATIAADLGFSKSTVLRSLADLDRGGLIKIRRAHGGLKQGNRYQITPAGFSFVTDCGARSESGVSNRYSNNNTSKELKAENTREPSASQDYHKKIQILRRYGIAWPVAKSLAGDHSLDDLQNAILNAVAQCQRRRTNDPRLARHIKIAGYIIATLNTARREGHTVQPNAFVRRTLARSGGQIDIAKKRLSADRIETRKAEMIRQLRAAVALEQYHHSKIRSA